MATMVNIGWGVDTVQMFLPGLFEKAGADSEKLIEQKNTENLNRATSNDQEAGDE